MLSHANQTQGANSPDLYIKKIHSVFEMHDVAYGSPDDLPAFVAKLREDRHLAMDFWALTAAISRNEGESFSNEQMLDIIVRGTTGKDAIEIRESGEEPKQATENLARLLSGEDIDNPLAKPEEPWPPQPTEKRTQDTQRKQPSIPIYSRIHSIEFAKEPLQEPSAADEPPIDEPPIREKDPASSEKSAHARQSAPANSPEETPELEDEIPGHAAWRQESDLKDDLPSSSSPTLSRKALDEALLQLERNSRLLRRHLEGIDRRMRRLEPRLQDMSSGTYSNPHEDDDPVPSYLPNEPDLTFDSAQHRPRAHGKNPRLVLLAEDDDPNDSVPLENYADSGKGISRFGWIALLLLLAAGGIFIVQHWFGSALIQEFVPRLEQTFQQTSDQVANEITRFIATVSPHKKNEPAATASSANSSSGRSTNSASNSAPSTPANNPAPASVEQNQPPETAASTPPPPSPQQPLLSVTPSSAALPPADSRASRTGLSSENSDYVSPSATAQFSEPPVAVSSAVMQENLVTSRVPAYPQAAKADGVEGPVVMQALISKNGTVDRLHVIQGDPLLRDAASEAVSKWHYRPYTVNGRPVEVATTVKVEFRLPRR